MRASHSNVCGNKDVHKFNLPTGCTEKHESNQWLASAQAFMNSVFDQAYGVLGDIKSVNGLLDQVQTVLDVDVDVPSINSNLTVSTC